LRALLKVAWRHFGLRAVAAREIKHPVYRQRPVHQMPKPKQAPPTETTIMDMRQFKKPKFLKVEDIRQTGRRRMRIAGVVMGQYEKPDLIFESGDKLGLSATNIDILSAAYGWEAEEWAGHLIELFVGKGQFNGGDVDMVLIEPISKAEGNEQAATAEPAKKTPNKPPQTKIDFDDQISLDD
jgi:hypothetical protein